jgi:SAM-dependent methyltransferase
VHEHVRPTWFDEPFFNYLSTHADDAAMFNGAMSAGSEMAIPLLLSAYDFSRFERIVDVGGGQGALLHAILSANPRARGVLYDLPGVVSGAAVLRSGVVTERSEVVGGDFFEVAPEGGDAYVLKSIIHDWDDEAAVRILTNCRRAIRPDGTLLLLETVLKPSSEPGHALMDLLMLVLLRGKERTESNFEAVLREAGSSIARVIPYAGGAFSIIESRPVVIVPEARRRKLRGPVQAAVESDERCERPQRRDT